jgi:hypothetical protein
MEIPLTGSLERSLLLSDNAEWRQTDCSLEIIAE